MRRSFSPLVVTVAALGVALADCNAILGIGDLPGPKGDAGSGMITPSGSSSGSGSGFSSGAGGNGAGNAGGASAGTTSGASAATTSGASAATTSGASAGMASGTTGLASGASGSSGTGSASSGVTSGSAGTSGACGTCTRGQAKCITGGLASCVQMSNGCWDYGAAVPCEMHQSCLGPDGAATCKCNMDQDCKTAGDVCTSPTASATCSTDLQGCVFKASTAVCTNQTCVAGSCAGVCAPNQAQCANGNEQTCGATGQWTTKLCYPDVCRRGACTACRLPSQNTDTLPFVVDSRFVASGYIGECQGVTQAGAGFNPTLDACTPAVGSRSSAAAKGGCYSVKYRPSAPDAGSCGGTGYAGVFWVYPPDNFGSSAGYGMPGAPTYLSFYARGALGGEVVSFGAGEAPPPSGMVTCGDSFIVTTKATLGTAWMHFQLPLPSDATTGGVVSAFFWTMAASDAQGGATFYIDDIEWQ